MFFEFLFLYNVYQGLLIHCAFQNGELLPFGKVYEILAKAIHTHGEGFVFFGMLHSVLERFSVQHRRAYVKSAKLKIGSYQRLKDIRLYGTEEREIKSACRSLIKRKLGNAVQHSGNSLLVGSVYGGLVLRESGSLTSSIGSCRNVCCP